MSMKVGPFNRILYEIVDCALKLKCNQTETAFCYSTQYKLKWFESTNTICFPTCELAQTKLKMEKQMKKLGKISTWKKFWKKVYECHNRKRIEITEELKTVIEKGYANHPSSPTLEFKGISNFFFSIFHPKWFIILF